MSAQKLIERLDHCRQSGKDKWIAKCPAHDDSSPSLSVKELPDGRVLIHCHAGCTALDVISSVGLEWGELFPPELANYSARRFKAPRETVDSLVIEITEHDRARGRRLSKTDVERYKAALKRNPPKSDAVVEILYESGAL